MVFVADEVIDAEKQKYRNEYDELFKLILISVKKSAEHLALIKQEKKLHNRTMSFLRKHSFYFSQKRKEWWRVLENKEIFGDLPKFENEKEKPSRYTT